MRPKKRVAVIDRRGEVGRGVWECVLGSWGKYRVATWASVEEAVAHLEGVEVVLIVLPTLRDWEQLALAKLSCDFNVISLDKQCGQPGDGEVSLGINVSMASVRDALKISGREKAWTPPQKRGPVFGDPGKEACGAGASGRDGGFGVNDGGL